MLYNGFISHPTMIVFANIGAKCMNVPICLIILSVFNNYILGVNGS